MSVFGASRIRRSWRSNQNDNRVAPFLPLADEYAVKHRSPGSLPCYNAQLRRGYLNNLGPGFHFGLAEPSVK